MGKKYLDTKEGSLEQSVLGVWQTAIEEGDARMDGRTKQYKEHRAKLEAARLRKEKLTKKQKQLDVDGDGSISHQEYFALDGFAGSWGGPSAATEELYSDLMALVPETVGTAILKGNQVLVAPDDELLSESIVVYFDHFLDINEDWAMTNKAYYEWYDN